MRIAAPRPMPSSRSPQAPRCARAMPRPLEPDATTSRRSTTTTPRCGSGGSISATAIGEGVGTIQPWPADEEVLIEAPPAHDPDFKRSALASPWSTTISDFESTRRCRRGCTGKSLRRDGRVQGRGDRRRQAAEDAGRAARSRRQAARQVGEVPRRGGLFRVARRGEARPDRGRPGGDEPGVLRLLSEQRLRRRSIRTRTASSPASSPSPATASPT